VQAAEQVKPPPPVPREADIAVEQEKKRKELEKKREQEQEELLEKQKQAKSAQDKLELDKEKREQLEKDKKQQAAQTALEKKLKEAEARKQEADAAADRQRNLERMAGLAGGTGAPGATGSAQQSSGPSSGYGGRVKARVKPNIVFTDDVAGNPATEVEVRTSPDGTIVGTRVTKSSGVRAWDDAVVRALEKTEVMPRDTDGRVPTPMIITFRPKEMLN
jgi:colicin import membrane protein